MSNPIDNHYSYALQVVDYLYTCKDLAMAFKAPPDSPTLFVNVFSKTSPQPDLGLHAYSDASFADAEYRKSTSGYLFKLAGGTFCHKSRK